MEASLEPRHDYPLPPFVASVSAESTPQGEVAVRRAVISGLDVLVASDATPERVWQVLTDFEAYRQWNPFMTQAGGRPVPGERLTILMQPQGGRAIRFQPTVREAVPQRRLRWLGHLLVPGIFDGEHSFTIEPLGGGGVRLVQQEDFRGALVPLLARSLDRRTRPAFERMNQALKQRCEQAHDGQHGLNHSPHAAARSSRLPASCSTSTVSTP